ncbi:hypothetical protein [Desulfosediminicola sp.]|uniref:hypothetical protein n=1 Tax=Desulfosediminicola sp. TaxID=2886825 RepID=UPI003AF26715
MALQKILLEGEAISAGKEKRILPSLEVNHWDRLHFHISAGTASIADISVRVLFGTPVGSKILLSDSTVWYEGATPTEREFSHSTPSTYNGTGFIMSVPVVAPLLYDIILKNNSTEDKPEVYVTVMGQEI